MSDQDASNKTEKPTPEKRKKARKKGQFARSKHAGAVASTVGVLLALGLVGPYMLEHLSIFTSWCFRDTVAVAGSGEAYRKTSILLAILAAPPALGAALFSTVAGFAQAGWRPTASLVNPEFSRINPLTKLKSMFAGGEGLIELALSLARLGAVGVVAYVTLADAFPVISRLAGSGLNQALEELLDTTVTLVLRATVALAVLAAVDYVQNYIRTERKLRMSRKELKDEMKQQEGDPVVRGRLRQRMREMSRQAVIAQVGASDVVVTNPTHVAVALRYTEDQPAPIVVALGYDEVALFMRRVARETGVPIVENRVLARAIAARARPGQFIPIDLYAAVAEVLAFVYALRAGRGRR
jgi:flagellar biosynthetic protein FlhB